MTIDRYDAERNFLDAMHAHGLKLTTHDLETDGRIHRCDVDGKAGAGDGAYLLRLDTNFAVGGYQDWTDGRGWQKWNYKRPGWQPTPQEQREIDRAMEQARSEHEKAVAKARGEARSKANRMWQDAEPAPTWHDIFAKNKLAPTARKYLDSRMAATRLC